MKKESGFYAILVGLGLRFGSPGNEQQKNYHKGMEGKAQTSGPNVRPTRWRERAERRGELAEFGNEEQPGPSKTPGDFCVCATRDQGGTGRSRGVDEFQVMLLKQILPESTQGQILVPLPSEAGVQAGVGRNARALECAVEV